MTPSSVSTAPVVHVAWVPKRIRVALQDAIAARDAGIAQAEASQITGWNRALIDQAIEALHRLGARSQPTTYVICCPMSRAR